MTPAQEFLTYALDIGAIELVPEGRKLKSGRISPYFFNSGLFNKGGNLFKLSQAYASAASCMPSYDVVFGPAYKGIPLATAFALALSEGNPDLEYAFDRKEEKDHGEGGLIVGASLAGKRVLIIDDVMTTGDSAAEAVRIIRKYGGVPVGCIIAFDRQERAGENSRSAVGEFERTYDIPVRAAATLSDLVTILRARASKGSRDSTDDLTRILAFNQQYGVNLNL